MRAQLILVFIIAVCGVMPDCRTYGETQMKMAADVCHELEISNAEMKKVYSDILKERGNDKTFTDALIRAQSAWTSFRDAHMEALYPSPPEVYGSSHGMCRCTVLNRMTRERIETLRTWLSGGVEGDLCAGSTGRKGEQ